MVAVAPDAVAAEGDGGFWETLGQHVNWEAVRKLKTFAGRYLPNSQSGAVTWMTRRTLFFSLVPEGNQTTKLQLIFWKYLSEKAAAGMSEEYAARQLVEERLAGAAEDVPGGQLARRAGRMQQDGRAASRNYGMECSQQCQA